MSLFRCFGCTKVSVQVRGSCNRFVTGYVLYGEQLLAPRPTPKLEDHPLSAVRDCLFDVFAAALLIGGRSSNRNPRTRHAVVTGTHLSLFCRMLLNSQLSLSQPENVPNTAFCLPYAEDFFVRADFLR
jgi:hypothetical protein